MVGETECFNLKSTYVVLGEEGNASPVAVSDRFYEDLASQFGVFKGNRLIAQYSFAKDWESWEMHPTGEEFVCLLSGRVDLVLEQDGGEKTLALSSPSAYVLVPRGIWHTAKVYEPSSVLFITPGAGTQHRPL